MGNAADDRLTERSRPTAEVVHEFPLFLMKWGDKLEHMKFMPLQEAGVLFDFGFTYVDTGGLVLNADMTVRKMTHEEERRISEIADEYSASK